MLRLVLLAALCTLPRHVRAADRWTDPHTLTVVMVDNRFRPDHLTLQSGKTYALRLENRGKDMHEFTAPAFFRAARVRNPSALVNGGTDVAVQPGQSTTILLIAPPPGRYALSCADHDWDGMVGQIEVE